MLTWNGFHFNKSRNILYISQFNSRYGKQHFCLPQESITATGDMAAYNRMLDQCIHHILKESAPILRISNIYIFRYIIYIYIRYIIYIYYLFNIYIMLMLKLGLWSSFLILCQDRLASSLNLLLTIFSKL